jgi:integrase
MPLLFRLLSGCGLRISEALNLRLQDVDLHAGVLTIIGGKFKKDRLVPMYPEYTQRCCDYVKVVHLFSDPSDYFFPAPGGPLVRHLRKQNDAKSIG